MDTVDKKVELSIARALGKRIRQLRQAQVEKLTQEELAERADISVSFLSMIERGERAPHIETLMRLASALKVSVGELFVYTDEPNAKSIEPMLLPLAEFARSHSLTRRDIERLLGVAKVMFKS
jgi:DNA-binding XRE family transcriptional regulator